MNSEETIPMYSTIAYASKITGLSRIYIRNRIKNGEIPFIKSGNVYMINFQVFLDILKNEEQSKK